MNRWATWAGCVVCAVGAWAAAQPKGEVGRDMRDTIVALRGSRGFERVAAVQSLEQRGLLLVAGEYAEITAAEGYEILGAEQAYIGSILGASRLEMGALPEIPAQDPYDDDPGPFGYLSAFRGAARHLGYDVSRCWKVGDRDGALERVSAMVRLGNALIDAGRPLEGMTGGAIRQLAGGRLVAIVEECEGDPRMSEAFSGAVIAELRELVEGRPRADPYGVRKWTVRDMRRRLAWMREEFAGADGARRFRAYLELHGQTEEELRTLGGLGVALLSEEGMRWLIEEDPDERKRGLLEFWESLTPEQRAAAIATHEEWTAERQFSPFEDVPRLYPDEAQNPREDEIAETLDEIEHLAARLVAAESRDAAREVFVLIRLGIERDRTQLTRMATMGGASQLVWRISLESYDSMVDAVETLEGFAARGP